MLKAERMAVCLEQPVQLVAPDMPERGMAQIMRKRNHLRECLIAAQLS
jgi:hypothetical protein